MLKHLAGLSSLCLLELTETQATNEGLKQVRKVNNLTWLMLKIGGLRTLYIERTKATEEGVNKLKNALPNCMVMR